MSNSNIYIIDIVRYYLKTYRIAFNNIDLYKVLVTDSNFPSLASISNTLDYYGISSSAFISDDKVSSMLRKNMLVHTVLKDGHFFIIKHILKDKVILYDGKKHSVPISSLLKIWDGIILTTTSSTSLDNCKSSKDIPINAALMAILICSVLLLGFWHCTQLHILLILLNSVGLALSILLVKNRTGINLYDKYCKIGKFFDCEIVSIKQPLSGIIPFHFDELGVFYFLWNISSALLINENTIQVVVSCASSLVCFSLLGYQAFVIGRYCLYCLGAYIVIWLSTAISVVFCFESSNGIAEYLHNESGIILLAVVMCRLIVQYIKKQSIILEKEIRLLRLKRDNAVYGLLTSKQPKVTINFHGLFFGRKEARNKISLIVSLDCEFCQRAIREASYLTSKFPLLFNCNIILTDSHVYSNADEKDWIKKHMKEYSVIHSYIHGNCRMSIFKDIHIQDVIEEEIPSIMSMWYNMQSDVKKNVVLDKLPLIVINGQIKPKDYDMADYIYLPQNQ